MNKRLAITGLTTFGFAYLFGAFVSASFDIWCWPPSGRLATALVALFAVICQWDTRDD